MTMCALTSLVYLYDLKKPDSVKRLVLPVFMMFFALSCLEEPDCIALNNNYVGITFKDSAGNADTVNIGQLVLIGSQTAILFMEDTTVTSTVVLLDYFTNESNYILRADNQDYSFKLTYTSQAQFVSEDCGERYVLSKLSAMSESLREITVTSATPGSGTSTKNLEIVLK
jgi:hypothetical protein